MTIQKKKTLISFLSSSKNNKILLKTLNTPTAAAPAATSGHLRLPSTVCRCCLLLIPVDCCYQLSVCCKSEFCFSKTKPCGCATINRPKLKSTELCPVKNVFYTKR
ncbi:unnamed protein product [Amaranthus hypochondriacus]